MIILKKIRLKKYMIYAFSYDDYNNNYIRAKP